MQSLEEAKKTKYKWFPYNKGGVNRKWYGNMEYVINWENNGYEVRNIKDLETGRIRSHNYNGEYSFRESGTWTAICSGEIMVRYSCVGALFDSKGASVFAKDNEELLYIIGLLNSKVSGIFLRGLSPAYEFKVGHIANVPFIAKEPTNVTRFVRENINLSKKDWDSFEVSWDFRKHVLVQPVIRISEAFVHWKSECISRFEQVKLNEEELNHIFIDTYELHGELSPKVSDNNVTIRKADLVRDIKSLISYAVGCMFGRYSLDVEGLAYAGGKWDSRKYSTFIPDKDNCIPITDKRYFDDDIVVLFEKWLIAVYGEDTLEQNLDFVAEALDNKGSSSREIIRNYFLNDFFKDHCASYSVTGSGKRPIYWLFDSGKQNGFKALIYMHRYNEDTVGRVLIYLQKLQDKYETEVRAIDAMLEHITDQRQAAAEEKRREHLRRQIEEVRDYDERLEHMANERVSIDLDDGVKVNYEKVQTDREGKKYQILAAIK